VVVLGEEPWLEMARDSNGQPQLLLYGKPATDYSVEWRPDLLGAEWQPVVTNLTIGTGLFLPFAPPPGSGPNNFYRAVRVVAPMTSP
jgi:hypothetical protein